MSHQSAPATPTAASNGTPVLLSGRSAVRLRTITPPGDHERVDDFDQLIADLADLDRRAARARLCLAAGGTREEAEAIMLSLNDTRTK
ncbi:hypothetical protein ABT340_39755 [Streptosporangium sp. NPDC000239]|uniref:hypothetical protein n=1 Tax=Streptosporangium sp. NPDC000239 TaxID=3154248 RepID=UPI00333165BB